MTAKHPLQTLLRRAFDGNLTAKWREGENLGGKRFHARYILTDVGGAGSEYGWDQGNSPGDQTDLYLLTESVLKQRIADFDRSGDVFTLAAGPHEFSGIRG